MDEERLNKVRFNYMYKLVSKYKDKDIDYIYNQLKSEKLYLFKGESDKDIRDMLFSLKHLYINKEEVVK
jgi:hypothetical protein